LRRRARDDGLHQAAADPFVLHRGIDRDRADAADRRALVEKIAAKDMAVFFRHDPVEAGIGDQHLGETGRDRDRREIAREIVPVGDRREGVVHDAAAGRGISGNGRPDRHCHRVLPFPRRRPSGAVPMV
jgi:hypothetical protein